MHLWLCLLVVRVFHLSSRKASVEEYRGFWFRMIYVENSSVCNIVIGDE